MAIQEPDAQDDDPRKRQAEEQKLGTQDPLFYEGKTPVLGEDVSLKQPSGELSFPQASPAAAPMLGPAPEMPTPPAYPEFPTFQFDWELTPPEFQFNPGEPPTPPSLQMPQPPEQPWWSKALDVGSTVADKTMEARKAYMDSQALGTAPSWTGGDPNLFSLTGAAPEQWFSGQENLYNLSGENLQDVLKPADYPLGVDTKLTTGLSGDTATAQPFSSLGTTIGPALNALGVGFGAYNAYNAEPGSPEQIASSLGAASGAAGLAGALGGSAIGGSMGLGGLAGAGAAAWPLAALALPYITGGLYEQYGPGSADKIQTPPGWQYVPGTGNSRGVGGYLVDPSTGRIVHYEGKGKYTPFGTMSPDQAKQYMIESTGELAKRPEYAAVNQALVNQDIAQAGQPRTETGQPIPPSVEHQRTYLQQWRQPYIDKIKLANPNAGEGELWRLYTLSPEYQQELLMIQGWNQGSTMIGGEGGGPG
jgi:hypothetical protein